jgi:hypothetical protein
VVFRSGPAGKHTDSDTATLAALDLHKEGSPLNPPTNGKELAAILARFWFNQEEALPQELVDAAIGLAKGLEDGLAKKIYSLIQRRTNAGKTKDPTGGASPQSA